MNPNPVIGVLYHWLGGLASGSFYVPYKGVKRWAWETYWLAGGFFSWIIAPWIIAGFLTKDLLAVLHEAPASALFWVFVCLLGITAAGFAGISKERVMSPEQQKAAIAEFDLRKGVGVAILSGVMSACFAYGLAAGDPIKALTLEHGTSALWQGLPVLVVVLIGGFLTNFIWCLILLARNKTGYQYFDSRIRSNGHPDDAIIETAVDAPGREVAEQMGVQHQTL